MVIRIDMPLALVDVECVYGGCVQIPLKCSSVSKSSSHSDGGEAVLKHPAGQR